MKFFASGHSICGIDDPSIHALRDQEAKQR
jgi:hypothetical protein